MKNIINKTIIILLLIFIICIAGCNTENGVRSAEEGPVAFPSTYAAEEYPLPTEYLSIADVTVRDGRIYMGIIRSINDDSPNSLDPAELINELCYIDTVGELDKPITIPYKIKEDALVGIYPNDDGTLSYIGQNYAESTGDGGITEVTETLMKRLTLDGEELSSISIMADIKNHQPVYISGFLVDSFQNTYVTIGDMLYIWDGNGKMTGSIKAPALIFQISFGRKGEVYILYMGGAGGYQLAVVDVETGTLGQQYDLERGPSYLDMTAGINSDLLWVSNLGVYEYDAVKGAVKEVVSFAKLNIVTGIGGGKLLPISGDRIAWMSTEFKDNDWPEYKLLIIKEGTEQDLVQNKRLTLGVTNEVTAATYQQAVAYFNKINPDVHIEIKVYGSNETGNGVDELNMDLVNGEGPDIMILPYRFSMNVYARQGVFADMYPYLDNDETLIRSDLQENILRAYESDGKLYAMPIVYNITTMAAPTSAVGTINQWDLDEMIAFCERYLPAGTIFETPTKVHVLSLCLLANGDNLINWSDGKPRFQREFFMKMLMFADRFVPSDQYVYDDRLIKLIHDDRQLQIMCCTNIFDFTDHQVNLAAFGEPVAYPGYPSEAGNGNLINSTFALAINNACDDKETAWQFVSSLLTEEFQWSLSKIICFPIRKSVLMRKAEQAMEVSYENDENGNQQEKKQQVTFGADQIDIYAPRQEDIQAILELIENTDKIQNWDENINEIVLEEARTFLEGSKTAEEVADIVENRVQIYLNEIE